LLYVALDEREKDNRTLGRVRDIISLGEDDFNQVMLNMRENPNTIVYSTAARTLSKEEKLRSNVLASLQAHTHFLDSPRIRASLARSDFKFEDLKTSKMTIYLVLPADRLQTFGRWLRLLIQQAITVNARNIEVKPDKPILFMLDEMAALGRLTMVEQAFGLMAGFGMQLWGIVQDLSQLEGIYGKGWETFIGNSGVLQYFGSRDHKTAEYFSKLCGVTTVLKFSFTQAVAKALGWSSSSTSGGQGGGSSTSGSSSTTTWSDSSTEDVVQRHLAYPDELMVLRDNKQLVIIENCNPIQGKKIIWHQDEKLKGLGVNLNTPKKGERLPSSNDPAIAGLGPNPRIPADKKPASPAGNVPPDKGNQLTIDKPQTPNRPPTLVELQAILEGYGATLTPDPVSGKITITSPSGKEQTFENLAALQKYWLQKSQAPGRGSPRQTEPMGTVTSDLKEYKNKKPRR
jgi:type IV secretion system protein VirD4